MDHGQIPEGLAHTRTTKEFDATTVPPGLLKAHTVADDVWGRICVRAGSVRFVWEVDGEETSAVDLSAGDSLAIPPITHHHVEPGDDAKFVVEFYR